MKKDKEWLKEKMQAMIDEEYRCYDPLIQQRKHTCRVIIDLIEQIDQPEVPVIPKFVADWIEEERANIIDWHTEIPERFFLILGHKLHYTALANTNISGWVFDGNEEKLYQALKYGYEVEKEKKYRVVFKNQIDDQILFQSGEQIFISNEYVNEGYWKQHFTEKEIKEIDERYWCFAEEVEQ